MSVRLFILGALMESDAHGYDIREKAVRWDIQNWSNIGFGSIYHALNIMEKEELVVQQPAEQSGNRPPKTVYSISDLGRQEFDRLLNEACRSVYSDKNPVGLGLAFIHHLSPAERRAAFEERMAKLSWLRDMILQKTTNLQNYTPEYNWALPLLSRDLQHFEVEIEWTRELLASLDKPDNHTNETNGEN